MLVVAFQWDQHAGHYASLIVAPVRAPHSKQGWGHECCIARGEMCESAFGLAARRATYPCKVDMVSLAMLGGDDARATTKGLIVAGVCNRGISDPVTASRC